MKNNIFFLFLLLIIPFKVYATNDVKISCNKQNLKINEETTCTISISNLDFTIIDITGKIKVGDNLTITSSSYDSSKWLSLDNNFSVTDINLMRHNNNKVNSVTVATFKIKASGNATGDSQIKFENIGIGNSDYQSISVSCNPVTIHFGNNIDTLSSLTISGINIDFSSEKTNYTAEIDSESVTIEAIPTDSKAKVSGTGNKKLNYGNNTINIIVTAENGITKTYTINVSRKDNRSNINELSDLKVSKGSLKFDKNKTDYTINVSNDEEFIDISYELLDNKSQAEIIGNKTLSYGENKFVIKVTAENGTVKEYTITVIRDKKVEITNSNKASNIIIKGYEISFEQNKYEYRIKTSEKKLDIKVTLEDLDSTYEIIGNENLTNGSIISIIVTDIEGNNNIYKIIIENNDKVNTQKNNSLLIILLIISIIGNIVATAIILKQTKILKNYLTINR